jgi:Fe-S-cluster-containing dehydrogenase component
VTDSTNEPAVLDAPEPAAVLEAIVAPETPPAAPETPPEPTDLGRLPPISRRQLLKVGAAAAPCLLGATAIFDWLTSPGVSSATTIEPIVANYDPTAHRWGFVVDTNRCIGCGRCVVACKAENGVPLDEEHTRTWVERHSVTADGAVLIDSPAAGANGFGDASAAIAGRDDIRDSRFVPRLCMQCEESPCTKVCPVGATFRTADGVILVDEQRCIGCGYCVVACPYGARYLVPAGSRTPTGVAGVADKCTFCYHRITRGQNPACVEVCPVGARLFGDLNDPNSSVSLILRDKTTRVLRPELGTKPRVHYVGLEAELG